jgi:hypothetical protein
MSRVVVRCVVALVALISLYMLMGSSTVRSTIPESDGAEYDAPFRQQSHSDFRIEIPIPLHHTADGEPPRPSVTEDPLRHEEGPSLRRPAISLFSTSEVWAAQGIWERRPAFAYLSPLAVVDTSVVDSISKPVGRD